MFSRTIWKVSVMVWKDSLMMRRFLGFVGEVKFLSSLRACVFRADAMHWGAYGVPSGTRTVTSGMLCRPGLGTRTLMEFL